MIVVTGPNGNVGAELVQRLMAQNELPFRIAAHHPEKVRRLFGASAPLLKFDFDDRATWPAVLEGIRMLFLLFPLPHPVTARERMVPFVAAAARAGCRHIVFVSVPPAERSKLIPHYVVERAIEASGVPYTFLRSGFFAQNLCADLSTHGVDIARHDEIFLPAGKGRTAFLDARDVAHAAHEVFRHPGPHRNKVYQLTGPEQLDFDQVAQVLSEELGRPIRYARPGLARWLRRYRRRGLVWDILLYMSLAYTLKRFGREEACTADLRALIGHDGRTLREFVRDHRHRWTLQVAAETLRSLEAARAARGRWRRGR